MAQSQVNEMNITPSGKAVSNMRETETPADNPYRLGGTIQKLQFDQGVPDDHPYKKYKGQAKGIKFILEERDLIPVTPPEICTSKNSNQFPGECQLCKSLKKRKA